MSTSTRLSLCFALASLATLSACGEDAILPPDDFAVVVKRDLASTDSAVMAPPDLAGDLAMAIPDLAGDMTVACSVANCPAGCCDANNNCLAGNTVLACGHGGVVCAACGNNQVCTSGSCMAASCDARTCPTGCCDGNNVCQPGDQPSVCGVSGNPCNSCAKGLSCIGGVCGSGGCTPQNCKGCCQGNVCIDPPTLMACATGGVACSACSPVTSDACANGACSCGGGAPCGANLHCVGGKCICDATACPNGCCQNNVCTMAAAMTCGANGSACVMCSVLEADTCTAGLCTCGGGAKCPQGLRCKSGKCICDAITCPLGCCDINGVCEAGNTTVSCGALGNACVGCSLMIADGCTSGKCTCGGAAACTNGMKCTVGKCM